MQGVQSNRRESSNVQDGPTPRRASKTVSSPQAGGTSGSRRAPTSKAKRRRRLTPEEIVKAAIRLADEDGLDGLSIRRVAAEVDARPMSLYNHFSSKDDLLAAMTDEAVGEMLVPDPLPEDWREAATTTAKRAYETYVAHRWLLVAFMRQRTPGPNGVKLAKQGARSLSGLRLAEAAVWHVQGIVNDYVSGCAFRTAQGRDPGMTWKPRSPPATWSSSPS